MPRLRFIADYCKHYFSAHSRHGVHSPFVYRLVDEVIYNYRAQTISNLTLHSSEKVNALLNRLIDFFKPEKVAVISFAADLENLKDFSFVLIGGGDPLLVFEACLPKAHAQSLFVFQNIYSSEQHKRAWKTIQAEPKVSLTIDLFFIGLVFFRTGQAKEDFKIRF